MIYCSDCHADDDEVSNGPHGSDYSPILRERYETVDNNPESYESYALCYRCHERTSILSDISFQKQLTGTTTTRGGHSGHLAAGMPCSVCHDPHGVNTTLTGGTNETGSHTHLINFDSRFVLPAPGNLFPIFEDTGSFTGGCTLTCHGKLHDHLTYP
jgi:hypothetical protein